ncbi:MAG: hypothetical protein HY936_00640 [Nitrosomonadales bacterium]|nr:hypothetical protein [Nitrosomonadales bacterium]
MKNLLLVIVLAAVGAVFPVSAFAKIDPAVLEKQRKENKARLEKGVELRIGKPKKRLFGSSEVEVKARSLKLDAIAPSPRRGAKTTSKKLESALPAKPGRTGSATKSEHNQKGVATLGE